MALVRGRVSAGNCLAKTSRKTSVHDEKPSLAWFIVQPSPESGQNRAWQFAKETKKNLSDVLSRGCIFFWALRRFEWQLNDEDSRRGSTRGSCHSALYSSVDGFQSHHQRHVQSITFAWGHAGAQRMRSRCSRLAWVGKKKEGQCHDTLPVVSWSSMRKGRNESSRWTSIINRSFFQALLVFPDLKRAFFFFPVFFSFLVCVFQNFSFLFPVLA